MKYTSSLNFREELCMRFLLYCLLYLSQFVWAESPNSFAQSKKIVQILFLNHPQTIYCGCTYQDKTVDLDSCGMSEAVKIKRANRIEIEHILRRVGNML